MPEEDFLRTYVVANEGVEIEFGWSDHQDTLFAKLYLTNPETGERVSLEELGAEPQSYYRLDLLIRDVNKVLRSLGIREEIWLPERVFHYVETNVLPPGLLKLMDISL